VDGYIQSAIDEGASVIRYGKKPTTAHLDKGFFMFPTIITNVTQKMKVAMEEIFGPVAVIMEKFNSDDEVIKNG
jgi:aldehyde dehydrogenase (NAD+)